jgi:hypothetical protein
MITHTKFVITTRETSTNLLNERILHQQQRVLRLSRRSLKASSYTRVPVDTFTR